MEENLKQKLDNYKIPKNAIQLIKDTKMVFVVGVTAAGKDTIRKRLVGKGGYHPVVSHTTRPPRNNHGVLEQNGIDYHFIDFPTADRMLRDDGYVEAKIYSGNIYGTSVAEIQKAHDEDRIAITDIEVQGVAEYKAIADNVVAIFLLPPDFATWQKRLESRYIASNIDPQDMQKRLLTAKAELSEALTKPYFEYVINKDLDETVRVVDEIAHGNFSREKNEQSRAVARKLLADLEKLDI